MSSLLSDVKNSQVKYHNKKSLRLIYSPVRIPLANSDFSWGCQAYTDCFCKTLAHYGALSVTMTEK